MAPLEIRLAEPSVGAPLVRPADDGNDTGAGRGLVINERAPADYDELTESLCGLLLLDYVESRREALAPKGTAEDVPQWLAAGLAQNLDPSSRARSRKLVSVWFPRGERPPVSAVLQWNEVAAGWHRDRALCGMVAAWIVTLKGGEAVKLMADRLAEGGALTFEWMAARIAGAGSAGEMDRAWNVWMDRQSRLVQEFGALSSAALEELQAETVIDVRAAGLEPAGLDRSSYRPRELIAAAGESAALRILAADKAQKIRTVAIGKAPEISEVGDLYGKFFEAAANRSWRSTLRFKLARAEGAFDRLMDLTRSREAYLDAIENERGAEAGDREEPVLEKSRVESYVDEAERRWPPSASGVRN